MTEKSLHHLLCSLAVDNNNLKLAFIKDDIMS